MKVCECSAVEWPHAFVSLSRRAPNETLESCVPRATSCSHSPHASNTDAAAETSSLSITCSASKSGGRVQHQLMQTRARSRGSVGACPPEVRPFATVVHMRWRRGGGGARREPRCSSRGTCRGAQRMALFCGGGEGSFRKADQLQDAKVRGSLGGRHCCRRCSSRRRSRAPELRAQISEKRS